MVCNVTKEDDCAKLADTAIDKFGQINLFELAPLHNPPNLQGIMACEEHCASVPQVAVFDTAFHATIL